MNYKQTEKQKIPKIIHQMWSEIYKPLPKACSRLAETWKEKHPDWTYLFWNEKMMDDFMKIEYPDYYDLYSSLPYDIQRWDTIRFFILKKMGGLYVDVDYECLENIEPLIEGADIAIALEPDSHSPGLRVPCVLSNALFASIPNHPFLDQAIDRIFFHKTLKYSPSNKFKYVLETTGPLMLSLLHQSLDLDQKSKITLLAAKHVMPYDLRQIKLVVSGIENDELESCLDEAYAVHYYTNTWV
jgi:Mannosyltransferase OCH1 and related enzymes